MAAGDQATIGSRAIFLHVLADALGSVGVIVSTLCIRLYGWTWADPVSSLLIAALLLASVRPLLAAAMRVLLLQTPPQLRADALPAALHELALTHGVRSCRDLHVWAQTQKENHGTIVVEVEPDAHKQWVLRTARGIFRRAGVDHMTVQVEG